MRLENKIQKKKKKKKEDRTPNKEQIKYVVSEGRVGKMGSASG